MVFCFVQNFFFGQHKIRIFFFVAKGANFFFQNLTLDYMTKTLNHIIFFSSTKIRIFFQKKSIPPPPFKLNGGSLAEINVREQRRANQKWTIHKNCQHRVHKTKTNKTRTQHNMCWTPLYTNKHKLRKIRHEPSYKQVTF